MSQDEIPDPIVVFHFRNSPVREQDLSSDHRACLALDWSRLQREAAADHHRAEHASSPDGNTTINTTITSNSSEDTSADGSRLQIAWESEHSETQSHQSECSESSETMVPAVGSRRSSLESATMKKLEEARKIARSTTTRRWNTMIALQNCEIPVVYHKNMARKFPVPARTPAQVEQRRRNTVAARLSRAKMKVAEMLMEKEEEELRLENVTIKRMVAAKLVYANALRTLLDQPTIQMSNLKRIGSGSDDLEVD